MIRVRGLRALIRNQSVVPPILTPRCMRRKFLVGLPNNEAESATGAAALRAQLQWSPEDDAAAESTGWSLVHCAALADDATAVRELAAEGEPVDKKLVVGVGQGSFLG